jgi:hypothetical protein
MNLLIVRKGGKEKQEKCKARKEIQNIWPTINSPDCVSIG